MFFQPFLVNQILFCVICELLVDQAVCRHPFSKNKAFVKDAEAQVEKGNKAAGTRARKASLELTKLFKEFRKQSIDSAK